MTKIVLAGCGSIAMLTHLPALKKLQQQGVMELAGVCDIDMAKARAAAEKFEVPAFGTNWEELVAQTSADAISVCLPPGPNAAVSTRGVEMGLHVICEKPPGRNVAQAEAMAAASARTPALVTMVAFNRRYAPLYVRALDHSLRLGRPQVFYGRFTRPGMASQPSNTASDWITSDGSHVLDLTMATLGMPRSLSVARRAVGSDLENAWTIQLQMDGGSAVLLFDFAAGRRVERFEWAGAGYDVVLELPEKGEWCGQGSPAETWSVGEVTRTEDFFVNYGWLGEYEAFAAAILGKSPRPSCDFRYAAEFMKVVDAILHCPQGEIRAFPAECTKGERDAAPAPRPHAEARAQAGRPVVQILQAPPAQNAYYDPARKAGLAQLCDLRLRAEDEWKQYLPESEVLVAGWGAVPLTPEDIERAEKLKMVVVVGASVKGVSPDLLLKKGVLVCNTADAIAQSVAEHCLLAALAGLRRLTDVDRQMHEGLWPPGSSQNSLVALAVGMARKMPGIDLVKPMLRPVAKQLTGQGGKKKGAWFDLQGQTVGLVGWGHIARHFARLLGPFNCRILVCSSYVSDEELSAINGKRASLGEILGGAKVISLHRGVSERSRGMIGAHELSVLPAGVVLVNTARAELFDEDALVARLQRGDIVAALDVFQHEPLEADHPLRKLGNVILSPHNASTTPQCLQRVGSQALDIIERWASGKQVPALSAEQIANMT
ncbi:MAG TPA: NAD(P)-dependent oxidoreductase [Bacteroidota bacterium]|nr:NAD(P)-dependent oxidoreductase [Bacteroidota bacterium]